MLKYYIRNPPSLPSTQVEPSSIHPQDFVGHFTVLIQWAEGYQIIYTSEQWREKMKALGIKEKTLTATDNASKDAAPKNHINPSHYKQLLVITDTNGKWIDTIQWVEHLQFKPFWRNNMHAFIHAVRDLCADKYRSRMGMKDDETQEQLKSLWYERFITAIMLNGYKPVRIADIDKILAEKQNG